MPRLVAASARVHLAAALPGLVGIGVFVLWAEHNGGYDPQTWYWGALLLLSLLALTTIIGRRWQTLERPARWALACFALYVLWSYASISWAASPGDALQGSNRALLYLIVFALFAVVPWTSRTALLALVTYAVGVGVIALVLLCRFAAGDHVANLVIEGRLAAPTGYFNASVALFTILALTATALAVRRELPAILRGALIALAGAGLQLALIGQSRGWLLTLPLVLIAAVALSRERFRVAFAAVIPVVAALAPVHTLLAIFNGTTDATLTHAAEHAGRTALIWCAAAFVTGTAAAWLDGAARPRTLSRRRLRLLGTVVIAVAVLAAIAGGTAATHGHPVRFIRRQVSGFTQDEIDDTGSHFETVGSGRYDFWRVSLDALAAHPLTGLGQDNFADYYILHRHTTEDPSWPHSLEMRLLAMTGIVGFLLFAGFVAGAIAVPVRAIRRLGRVGAGGTFDDGGLHAAVIATSLLPAVDWLIHGSVDWLWEMPALSGPALGFLGVAVALAGVRPSRGEDAPELPAPAPWRSRPAAGPLRRVGLPALGVLALAAAVAVLGLSYLSVREQTIAGNLRASNPEAALSDLSVAARLDPLSSGPGRLAGTIALQDGLYEVAEERYLEAIERERGGWFAWFGRGLAASALGQRSLATHDFRVARGIERDQPVIAEALARVDGPTPVTPAEGLSMLIADT
jgi:hypothetical protein